MGAIGATGARGAVRCCSWRRPMRRRAPSGDGSTPLHWAAYRDDLAKVDQLIRAGANVNAANDIGVTPLWAASLNGSAPIVKRLLEAGANPDAALLSGETPLMAAATAGKSAVVEALLGKGANPNARGPRGADRFDVGGLAEACRRREAAPRGESGRSCPHRKLEPDDGRAAARPSRIQPDDSARRRHGAHVRGPRRRCGLGEAAGRSRRQRERSRCLGRERDDAGGVFGPWRDCAVSARQGRRSQ